MNVSKSTQFLKEDDAAPTNGAAAIAGTGAPTQQGQPPGPQPVFGILKRKRVRIRGMIPGVDRRTNRNQ
jgi:hypothetical protein